MTIGSMPNPRLGALLNSKKYFGKDHQTWANQLQELDFDTPFTVIDLNEVRNNAGLLKSLLPNVDIYYAIKSNPDGQIVNAIKDSVKGFEVASAGEISYLLSLGIPSNRILYSNPVKVPSHIRLAYAEGVQYYAYDSIDEIKKLAELAPGSKVCLRLKVADYGSKFPLSKKFGVNPSSAIDYIQAAIQAGLQPVGLSFHIGSQSEEPKVWKAAFETCSVIISQLEKKRILLSLLNIGGGIPAPYSSQPLSILPITRAIKTALKRYIPSYVHIIAEPGRFISATSSVITTEVIGRETRAGNQEWLFLDMGVFQGLMEPLESPSWRYPIFSDYDEANVLKKHFVLTGPTCDTHDTIGFDYLLPENLKVGDRLYIGSAGAYTSVYQTQFNGFKPPQTHYINV